MTVGGRNGVYSRYSACDWDASAKMQIKLADRETHRAQRLDKRSWEIVHGLEQRMRNRQCSNTKKLGVHSRVCSQARYSLTVFTGRVHGCRSTLPVFTGRICHVWTWIVNMGRVHGCSVHTTRVFTCRVDDPWSRVLWSGAREHGP